MQKNPFASFLELHMDLTNYYELKYQPHDLRMLPESLGGAAGHGEACRHGLLSRFSRCFSVRPMRVQLSAVGRRDPPGDHHHLLRKKEA